MGDVIDFSLFKTIQVPDEIMMIPAGENWAKEMSKFLDSSKLAKGKDVFFKIGQDLNGKFYPFDDFEADGDALLEAYHKLVIDNLIPDYSLFVCQKVDSIAELRN